MQENIKVEALSTTEYQISINVPSSAVDKKFDEFFKKTLTTKTHVFQRKIIFLVL